MTMEDSSVPVPYRSLESSLPLIESLLKQVIRFGRFELKFVISKCPPEGEEFGAPEYVVDFSGADADLLVEKNGTLLDSLEYLVLKAVRLEEGLYTKITFDSRGWRRLRAEELKLTARVAAERVIETGDAFPLNPMSPRERRLIHLALRDQPQVRTESEGTGPERKVVILPTSPPARRSSPPIRKRR
jgi:spoIIIJ-associated protein